MLVAHNISKSYGPVTVLREVSFSLNAGERVGLIGPNGSGKSTLFRLLIGQEKPDRGFVTLDPPNLRIGYLSQGFDPAAKSTLADFLHEIVGDPRNIELELARLADALAATPNNVELQLAYDRKLTQLRQYESESGRVESVLAAVDLDGLEEAQTIDTLSGGQKTRLGLALVLLGDPQLLLLDEPANHLDIAMLRWLEDWLADFAGSALIVSHDRTFLDRTVTRILDLDPTSNKIKSYAGNYSDYFIQYVSERDRQMAAYKDQVYEIRRMRQDIQRTMEQARWVERTTTPRQPNVRRYAKKVARKAKSRERKLERFLASDDRVKKPARSWQMKLELDNSPHLGSDVLTLEGLTVGYPQREPLVRDVDQRVLAGQRIAFTGPNGAGKSTLLRAIAGHLKPVSGKLRLGASVSLGYMAQEQELLDLDQTPLTTILGVAKMNETEARGFLHYFLFTGDDALHPNRSLSYGERARLSLALLVAQGCNFLLLDEPINHLDIPSREQFEQALTRFDGTVLAVVHDRYFVSRFATDLWIIENRRIRSRILRR